MEGKFTVFLSGPGASHNPDYRAAFYKAQNQLESRGFAVVNLAVAFPAHWDHTVVMPHCVEAVKLCDAIYMLPGWENSKGAVKEYKEATKHKIPAFTSVEGLMCWLAHNGGDTP